MYCSSTHIVLLCISSVYSTQPLLGQSVHKSVLPDIVYYGHLQINKSTKHKQYISPSKLTVTTKRQTCRLDPVPTNTRLLRVA